MVFKVCGQRVETVLLSWWCHQMETFSVGNSPVTGEFPLLRPVMRSFDVVFCLICTWINGWVNHCEAGDLRCHCAHYDAIVMKTLPRSSGESILGIWPKGTASRIHMQIFLDEMVNLMNHDISEFLFNLFLWVEVMEKKSSYTSFNFSWKLSYLIEFQMSQVKLSLMNKLK